MSKRRSDPLSFRAFALLVGCDESAVRKGARTGRLTRSLGRDAKGRPHIADVGLARREWTQNATRPARRRGGPLASLAEAQRQQHVERTRGLKLKNDLAAERVLDAGEVEAQWAKLVVQTRNTMLGVSTKLKGRRPNLDREDLAAVDSLIREALEELAGGRGDAEATS